MDTCVTNSVINDVAVIVVSNVAVIYRGLLPSPSVHTCVVNIVLDLGLFTSPSVHTCVVNIVLDSGLFTSPRVHTYVVKIVLYSEGCLHFPVCIHVL